MPDRVVRPALSRIAPEQTETREISAGIAPAPQPRSGHSSYCR